ncbi:Hypothetical predicted protein [Octopus vulgaris]|uniref:DUF885 domain-containing protein n=1 Tax=Octopus vulgaris TaxID=6645 RepID=A0AA36BSU4_OCTVU|nr:Hypothetical predicted protein [Octopus vulgaris]
MTTFFQTALVLLFTTTAFIKGTEDTSSEFVNLEKDIFDWQQMQYPTYFYEQSRTGYNTYSIKEFSSNKDKIAEFLIKLEAIKTDKFSANGKMNYKMTRDMLQKKLDGYRWHLYGALTPTSFLEPNPSPILGLFNLVGDEQSEENLNTIFKITDSIPDVIKQYTDLMKQAISLNRTLHNVSMIPVVEIMEDALNKTEDSFFHTLMPYIEKLNISTEEKLKLERKGNETISKAMVAYGEFLDFIKSKYLPATREDISINSWHEDMYQQYLGWHLDSNVTADRVHQLGLDEAKRIKKRVKAIMNKQNFKGSIAEYMKSIGKDKSFQLQNADEIFKKYKEIIKNIRSKLDKYFRDYEEMPLIIAPTQTDGPAAVYNVVRMNGQTKGVFGLNVMRPLEMPTYEMSALALHEAVPGHHFQSSYLARSKQQSWRTKGSLNDYFMIPYQFPFYTAFVEGWGLYSEFLGEEMGIYKTDYDRIGRYAFELLRAYRLVIDTGIHAKQMTRQHGIDLLTNFTGLSEKQASIEIDRYITIPGQACAYKFGELKIRELRRKAEKALGDKFDLKDFHAAVLENGRVPLDILEQIVDNMIEKQKQLSAL